MALTSLTRRLRAKVRRNLYRSEGPYSYRTGAYLNPQ